MLSCVCIIHYTHNTHTYTHIHTHTHISHSDEIGDDELKALEDECEEEEDAMIAMSNDLDESVCPGELSLSIGTHVDRSVVQCSAV